MASKITRLAPVAAVPVGATFAGFRGVLADDSISRPNPAAVYAEPATECCSGGEKQQEPIERNECSGTELEKAVMAARKGLSPYKGIIDQVTDEGMKQVGTFYKKLQDNLCYLRTNAPQEVRIGTIALGGLTGLLLSIRKGFFRKILMTTAGAGTGAYLAYPYETEKYTRKYTGIAYNFIAGVGASK